MFRNAAVLRASLPGAQQSELPAQVAACALKPCGPLESASVGFVSPYGRSEAAWTIDLAHALGVCVGQERKVMPGGAVAAVVAKRLAKVEQSQGRAPGARERRRIRDEVVVELLPKALVRPSRTAAYLDTDLDLVVIDTSSAKAAETVVAELRRALGSFPALRPAGAVAPGSLLTDWLSGEALPAGLMLGDECELRDPADSGGVVRVRGQDLRGEEIDQHLAAGKQCTRLGLMFRDQVQFVLGDDVVLRKIKFLDGALAELDAAEISEANAETDARFILLVETLRAVWRVLAEALRWENKTA